MDSFILPEGAKIILEKLIKAGFEAWCVGGCVRDMILCTTPSDYDIATNASPKEIMALFTKVIPTGIKHGTVTVMENGTPYEVTKYRIDGKYTDCRHPDKVTFTDDFLKDLSRRDFTVNAIGYNPEEGIYDPFCGKEDIKSKTIKAVGDAKARFSEDALRILRAVRFASKLDFNIEQNTLNAVIKLCPLLKNISGERIREELLKTLSGNKPHLISIIIENGGLKDYGLICCKNSELLSKTANIPLLRLAVLCYLCKADACIVAEKLKLSNKDATEFTAFFNILCSEEIDQKLLKSNADACQYESLSFVANIYGILHNRNTEKLEQRIKEAYINNEPYCIKMLDISGKDLLALNFKGEQIGILQNKLLNYVLVNPKSNKKEILLQKAIEFSVDNK